MERSSHSPIAHLDFEVGYRFKGKNFLKFLFESLAASIPRIY